MKVAKKKIFDDRGVLTKLTFSKVPKNIFFLSHNKRGLMRGNHAHKKTTQWLMVISGNCIIKSFRLGNKKENEQYLNFISPIICIKPKTFIKIENMTPDCVIMVIANKKYSKKDYLYNTQNK